MQLNDKGLQLIKSSEGCKLTAYQDQVGVWTIGVGHTGTDVKKGMKITQQEADNLLKKDLEKFCKGVSGLLTVLVNENQFGALVSFSFNLGLGALGKSNLLKKINSNDFQGAAIEFLKWDKAGGVQVKGLTARRTKERDLFCEAI